MRVVRFLDCPSEGEEGETALMLAARRKNRSMLCFMIAYCPLHIYQHTYIIIQPLLSPTAVLWG